MKLPTAEIVCLGNELLIGVTTNTNATYIGEHLTKLGFDVRRTTCIRDEVNLAVEFFGELFERKPNLIIISGGLGPTYDDIQLEVLSKATGLELVENADALEQVKEYYAGHELSLTKERRKMSFLPESALVLENDVGGAPGCYISFKGISIYCLPGVPTEMKDIFSRHIIPKLKETNQHELIEEKFQVIQSVESQLAPSIAKVKARFDDLYIKSHPAYKDKPGIIIHISGIGEKAQLEVDTAKELLQKLFTETIPDIMIKELEE